MTAAPAGALVRIFYDGRPVLVGEALRTTTGRIYVVADRRVQQRGKHVGRQHLTCHVCKAAPEGVKVLSLRWYRRGKGKRNG